MPPHTGKILLTQLDSLKLAGCFSTCRKEAKMDFLRDFKSCPFRLWKFSPLFVKSFSGSQLKYSVKKMDIIPWSFMLRMWMVYRQHDLFGKAIFEINWQIKSFTFLAYCFSYFFFHHSWKSHFCLHFLNFLFLSFY